MAERLVEQLVEPLTVDGFRLQVGVSIGVALYPDHGAELDTLLQQADAAMYKAKRERLGFVVCNVEQKDSTRRQLELRRDILEALAADRLLLHFQPKVAADSREVVGFEALLRWPHPELGLLEPGAFLPVVEQTGLVARLAFWTLNACLREQRRWRYAGHDLPVAVNPAPACLRLPEPPRLLRMTLGHWEARADRLVLELPESAVMADVDATAPVLRAIAVTGCELALDEFGAGRSSLVHLARLSVHELEIPRTFVQAMDADGPSRVVARSIVGLAHGLGHRVVATGVETETNAARLRAMRRDQLRGFLFGRPVPGEEVPALLRAGRLPAGCAPTDRTERACRRGRSANVATGPMPPRANGPRRVGSGPDRRYRRPGSRTPRRRMRPEANRSRITVMPIRWLSKRPVTAATAQGPRAAVMRPVSA